MQIHKADKELCVLGGKGMGFELWRKQREDKISPVLPTQTCRKPWPSGSGSSSQLLRRQDCRQRGNLVEIRDEGVRTS